MKDWAARGVNVPSHHGSLNGYLVQLIIIIYLVWLARREVWGVGVDRYTSARRRTRDLWYFTRIHTSSRKRRLNDADPFGNWKRLLFVQKTRLMRFCWLWNRSPSWKYPKGLPRICSDNLTRLIFVITGPGHDDDKILISIGIRAV